MQPLEAQEIKPFAVTDVGGYLQLRIKSTQESRSRAGEDISWDSEALQFREGLRLDMDGYIYHPRFVKLHLGGLIEYIEEMQSGTGWDPGGGSSLPLSGDFNFSFFEQHAVNLTLYGSRSETEVDQPFARSFLLNSDFFSVSLGVRKGPLPTELTLSHNATKGFGLGSDIDEVSDDLLLRSSYGIGERSKGNLEYHLTNTDQGVINRTFTTQQLALSNVSAFGEDDKVRLTSNLRFYEQKSFVQLSSLSLYETLNWRHSEKLHSRYHLSFDTTGTGQQSSDRLDVGAGVRHQLYQSLETNAEIYGRFEDASYGTIIDYGSRVTESYTKELGKWGRLSLALRGFGEMIETNPSQTTASVVREAHVLSSQSPTELGHTRVVSGSIRVTDDRGIRVYTQLLDYMVLTVGEVVQITPVLTGRIPEGATVLIDYEYALPGAGAVLTSGGQADGRLNVGKLLSLYAKFERSEQEQVSGEALTRLESLERRVAGTMVTWRWLTAGAEYEDRDSVLSPVQSMSEWVSLSGPLFGQWRGQISASYRDSKLGDTGRAFTSLDAHLMLSGQVTTRSRLSIEADYRQQKWDKADSLSDLDGYGVRIGYGWRYGKFSVDATARLSLVNQHGQEEDRNRVDVKIRREF